MKNFIRENWTLGLVIFVMVLVLLVFLFTTLMPPSSPLPTPTPTEILPPTPTDIISPIPTPISIEVQSLEEGRVITGVTYIYWDDPPYITKAFSISATHPITVDLTYKLQLERLDEYANYQQEISFSGINLSLAEEWNNTTGQFDGEIIYSWIDAPYYGHYEERHCLEYLVHQTNPTTPTFTVYGFEMKDGVQVPYVSPDSCYSINRVIDNRLPEPITIFLPIILKKIN